MHQLPRHDPHHVHLAADVAWQGSHLPGYLLIVTAWTAGGTFIFIYTDKKYD